MSQSREDKATQWREIFADWTAGGMSVVSFCQSRQIPVAGFYYWKRRLGVPGVRQLRSEEVGASTDNLFWRVTEDTGASSGVTVLVGGYRLELSDNFTPMTLLRAVAVLSGKVDR